MSTDQPTLFGFDDVTAVMASAPVVLLACRINQNQRSVGQKTCFDSDGVVGACFFAPFGDKSSRHMCSIVVGKYLRENSGKLSDAAFE
jgi:hypothetical protein